MWNNVCIYIYVPRCDTVWDTDEVWIWYLKVILKLVADVFGGGAAFEI